MEIIAKYGSITLLGILAAFVVFGMLTGMARGFKRSLLRLVLYIGLLVAVFLLTPVVTDFLLGLNVQIAGRTPNGWVDFLGDKLAYLLQDMFGKYVTPFGSYVKEFAVGLVLAIVNIVLFMVLYFVMKFVSWIIYSIVARIWAPVKDRNGKKYPKHAFGGMLVGALQGVALFVFFMLPINGVIGVVNQAVIYQNAEMVSEVETLASLGDDYVDETDDEVSLEKVFADIDSSLTTYNQIMRCTGLQFLSNKAFEYQLTVRIQESEAINLVHDVNTAWELYIDAQNLEGTLARIEKLFNGEGYTLTAADYQKLRNVTNKAFDLHILRLADWFLADLDNILNTPFGEDKTYLAGTDIYAESIYGYMIQSMVTEREVDAVINKEAELADGLRALVNYVAQEKLDLVKNDILTLIDIAEALATYKIVYEGEVQTLIDVLASNPFADWDNALDLLTARLTVASGDYAVNTPVINVIGANLKKLSLAKMLGVTDVEKIAVYGYVFDEAFGEDTDLQTLFLDLSQLFLGEKAYTQGANQGNWEKLGNMLFDTAEILSENRTIFMEIADMFSGVGATDIQAIFGKIGELIISEEYYNAHQSEFNGLSYENVKYQKADRFLGGIYDLVNTFEPVQKFLVNKIDTMAGGSELLATMADLLTGDRSEWNTKCRSLISAANLMNNQVITDLLEGGNQELTSEDVAGILDALQTELDAGTVVEIVDTVVNLPEVGESVKETLNTVLDEVVADSTVLEDIFGVEDAAAVTDQIQVVKDYMNEGEIDKEVLEGAVSGLLEAIKDNEKIKELLGKMNPVI